LKSLGQNAPGNVGVEVLNLLFREDHGGVGTQGAACGAIAGADLNVRGEPLGEREIHGLADQQVSAGVVQIKYGAFLEKDAANAGWDPGKNLLDVPVWGQKAGHVQQHLQAVHLSAQFAVRVTERFFQLSLRSNLDHKHTNAMDDSARIFDREVVQNPVADVRSSGKQSRSLEVHRLSRPEHVLKLGFHEVREFTEDFPHGSAQVVGGRFAVHGRERIVDSQVAESGIQNGQAHGRGTEISCYQLFWIGQSFGVREQDSFARSRGARITHHNRNPQPTGLTEHPHPTLSIHRLGFRSNMGPRY
jgi:hypothetical protein